MTPKILIIDDHKPFAWALKRATYYPAILDAHLAYSIENAENEMKRFQFSLIITNAVEMVEKIRFQFNLLTPVMIFSIRQLQPTGALFLKGCDYLQLPFPLFAPQKSFYKTLATINPLDRKDYLNIVNHYLPMWVENIKNSLSHRIRSAKPKNKDINTQIYDEILTSPSYIFLKKSLPQGDKGIIMDFEEVWKKVKDALTEEELLRVRCKALTKLNKIKVGNVSNSYC